MNAEALTIITEKASIVAATWPDVHVDDLTNELVVFWLENEPILQSYLEMPDQTIGLAKLHKSLNREAYKWCRKETCAIRGHDDYALYTRTQVKLMLPLLNMPAAWGSLAVTGAGGKSSRPANEGGDTLATFADLTSAWGKLGLAYQELLNARYVNDDPECFSAYGDAADAARKRTDRALDALVMLLAGKPKTSLRRRAVSNAAAQSQLGKEY